MQSEPSTAELPVSGLAEQIFGPDRIEAVGDAVAVICGDRRLSYREFLGLVDRVGLALRDWGIATGDVVTMTMLDTPEQLATYFAAMKIGAVPIALSTRLKPADLGLVLAECRARLLVCDSEHLDTGRAASGDVPSVLFDELLSSSRARPEQSLEFVQPLPGREAFWVFSSGTTGRSKGVRHAHGDLRSATRFHADDLKVEPGDVVFCTSRMSFAYTVGNGILGPLFQGAAILLHPEWPSPASTFELIRDQRPDVVFSTPSLYRAWLDHEGIDKEAFSKVRYFISAGEPLPAKLYDRWMRFFDRPIYDCYGVSETVFFVFANTEQNSRIGSVGRLTAGASGRRGSRIDDEESPTQGRKLFIQHPFLAQGYGPGSPAQQQHRFGREWFSTGDLFFCDDDGYWFFRGREDDLLKVAGQWVHLKDVEDAALKCDAVAVASAVAVEDADGMLRIALFVQPAGGVEPDAIPPMVRDELEGRLARHQRPKWIHLIGDFPRTNTGKIRKSELKKMLA